jgi:hypothetical protein
MYTLASKYEASWGLPRHINEYEYEDLPHSNKRKYVSDEGYTDDDDEPSVFDVLAVGVGVVDLLGSLSSSAGDFDRDDDGPSFDGFGGGSTGGAGAGGEW